MPQQELFSYVNKSAETCTVCKEGELVLNGEFTKTVKDRVTEIKIFKCSKCGYVDKRCS